MHTISMTLASLLAQLYYTVRPTVVINKTELPADPRPLARADCEYMRQKVLQPAGWRKGMSIEEVAYHQGMHDLVGIIETTVIRRHADGIPEQSNRRRKPFRQGRAPRGG